METMCVDPQEGDIKGHDGTGLEAWVFDHGSPKEMGGLYNQTLCFTQLTTSFPLTFFKVFTVNLINASKMIDHSERHI